MPFPTLLRLMGAAALLAVAAPAIAQGLAPSAARGTSAVRVVPAAAARRATNLQRPPIVINLLDGVATQDRAAPAVRTASAAATLSRPERN